MAKPNKHLKVVYELSNEPVDIVVSNALLTNFMVYISRIGLRVEKGEHHMVIVSKENKND